MCIIIGFCWLQLKYRCAKHERINLQDVCIHVLPEREYWYLNDDFVSLSVKHASGRLGLEFQPRFMCPGTHNSASPRIMTYLVGMYGIASEMIPMSTHKIYTCSSMAQNIFGTMQICSRHGSLSL